MKARTRSSDDLDEELRVQQDDATGASDQHTSAGHRRTDVARRARASLREASIPGLALGSDEVRVRIQQSPLVRQRRSGPLADPELVTMNLVLDGDGVLRWEVGSSMPRSEASSRPTRAATRRDTRAGGHTLVEQAQFEPLPPSKVTTFLKSADERMTPRRGLLRYDEFGKSVSYRPSSKRTKKKFLLCVHGTSSDSQHLFDELVSTPEGRLLFATWQEKYEAVLGFDHATFGVSPILNAVDLHHAFGDNVSEVDVFAHSRGGLVVRWWLELFEKDRARVQNVVLVGSPLVGTSLAAPAALRKSLDFMSNVMTVLNVGAQAASAVMPLAGLVQVWVRLVGTIFHWAASAPIADAALGLVPGLGAMSRVAGNAELERLHELKAFPIERLATVEANFEPKRPGWQFWKRFTDKPVLRLVDAGADFLFGGANDLVVDTLSMSGVHGHARVGDASGIVRDRRCCPTGDEVHHVNYFSSGEVVRFLGRILQG